MATVRDSGTACTPHLSTLQLQLLSASRVSLEPLQDAAAELVEGLDLFFQMLVLGKRVARSFRCTRSWLVKAWTRMTLQTMPRIRQTATS